MSICSCGDRLVKVLLEQANMSGETYILSRQMADSMYRVLYRAEDNIHYVDEIYQKQLTLTIIGNNNRPVENAQVVGFLPSQSVIGGVSNAHGNVYLFWETADSNIERLIINGITKEGVFKENSNIVVSIAEQQLSIDT